MKAYISRLLPRTFAPKRAGSIMLIALLLFLGSAQMIAIPKTNALQMQNRSLRIEDPTAGVTTRYTFTFSYADTATPIGSLLFQICTDPFIELPCNAPTGIDASGATLTQQAGETGFTVLARQTNSITLSRAPTPPVANPSQYIFDNVVNPTGAPRSFYVRITTYTSLDASGTNVDYGGVVNATTQGIAVSTKVPPILKFCVGLVLGDDCTTADDSVVDLGNLSSSHVSSGSSQLIAATNAQFGLAVAMYGTTMTSGTNVIPALGAPTVSAPGNAQFGLNLRANSDPVMGQDPGGPGVIIPTSNYNAPNRYMFQTGDTIATSPVATDSRKLTSTYIVNVPPTQSPGVYTATLTYICTATF